MTDLLTELEALARGLEKTSRNDWDGVSAKLRSLIAAEKARGPNPLLVQVREALVAVRRSAHYGIDTAKLINAAIAALDACLGVKR